MYPTCQAARAVVADCRLAKLEGVIDMLFQVRMLWDDYDPHPAFTDLQQAIAYAEGLLARLPEDAHPETEVNIADERGDTVFSCSIIAWRIQEIL
jgi:hypothetical protein